MTTAQRPLGAGRINDQQQITIPADALRAAGLEVGDRLVAHAEGGRVVLEREHDALAGSTAGLTGVFRAGEMEALRADWD